MDPDLPWRTPANLLDSIEKEVRSLYTGDDGEDFTVEVLLCMLIPELRDVLREAGLSVPKYGPHSAYRDRLATQYDTPAGGAEPPGTALYRWYDEEDLLLYVGISDNLDGRTQRHTRRSSWMAFAARRSVERHLLRDDAEAAERAAIEAEQPLFNFRHNETPEARTRLVEYLVKHNRVDLLAPAISRG